jgi:hypothetical protein
MLKSEARSRDDSLLRLRSPLPSRGEGPSLFEQWGSPLEETGVRLLRERRQRKSLQNNLRRSDFESLGTQMGEPHTETALLYNRRALKEQV